MVLTKKQCWDIIRKMVSDKYNAHSSFIASVVGDGYNLLTGNIKRVYLNKFNLETESDFKELLKKRGVKPKREWLDNLSSEDLLIFLDYFCRSLQMMYEYYDNNKQLFKQSVDAKKRFEKETKNILSCTEPHRSRKYNVGRLKATGCPKEVDGEKVYTELGLSDKELQKQAIIQVVAYISYNYALKSLIDIEDAIERVITLRTHTVNNRGYVEGYINNITVECVIDYLNENFNLDKIRENIEDAKYSRIK